jgi:hypothetical protein
MRESFQSFVGGTTLARSPPFPDDTFNLNYLSADHPYQP